MPPCIIPAAAPPSRSRSRMLQVTAELSARLRHYCLSVDVAAPLEADRRPGPFRCGAPAGSGPARRPYAKPHVTARGDREARPPYLALAPEAAAVLGGRGDAVELEDLPVTPPPSDADKPGPGGRKPDTAAAKPGQANPSVTDNRSAAAPAAGGKPVTPAPSEGAKPNPAAGTPPKPATEPVVAAKPGTAEAKPETGKPGSGDRHRGRAEAGVQHRRSAYGHEARRHQGGAGQTPILIPSRPIPARSTLPWAAARPPGLRTPRRPRPARSPTPIKPDAAKPDAMQGRARRRPASPEFRPRSPAAGRADPRPGRAAAASAVTAGPIIDLKAKRVPDATPRQGAAEGRREGCGRGSRRRDRFPPLRRRPRPRR